MFAFSIFFLFFIGQNIHGWQRLRVFWVVALSHGPEPTEQTLGESKENTATKSQWSAALGLRKKEEEEKNDRKKKSPFSFSQTCIMEQTRYSKGAKAASCVHNSLLTDRQLLMLTHICMIKFAFVTLCLKYMSSITVIMLKNQRNP